jgi:hypothetical protein
MVLSLLMLCALMYLLILKFLTRKSSGGHQAKRGKKPKPEEHKGMPQRQHCPPEKHRGDRNPECHEELQKDVA